MSKIQEKSGVKTNVLKTLIKEEDKLEIEGDRVTVNGTEIKEWAKTNQPDFYVALFPKTHSEVDLPGGGSNVTDLPQGGSNSDQSAEKKPVAVLVETDFKVPSFLKAISS